MHIKFIRTVIKIPASIPVLKSGHVIIIMITANKFIIFSLSNFLKILSPIKNNAAGKIEANINARGSFKNEITHANITRQNFEVSLLKSNAKSGIKCNAKFSHMHIYKKSGADLFNHAIKNNVIIPSINANGI